jgi:methionyl-tRNA formyltransferase
MRVAFFGSSRFSCLVLEAIKQSAHAVAAVVTQPDQPKGRKMAFCPTPVCDKASLDGFPVLKPDHVKNNPGFRRELMAQRPDALLVASFGQIISKKVLALTEWPLNVHPSALPKLRGASPVRTALLQGLEDTACCIMRMTPRLDDGDVLLRESREVLHDWNHEQLETALGELGGRLAVKALDHASAGIAQLTPQDHSAATHCTLYRREDTVIDWTRSARDLRNFIRAWDPDIGALTTLPDGRRLKVWGACVDEPPEALCPGEKRYEPGEITAVSKKALWVSCGSGTLRLVEVQPESKGRMCAASFLAGAKLEPGQQLHAAN